jgi:hypothetical protein
MLRALGKVTVTTPGTPVPITAILPADLTPAAVHAVLLQALPSNTGAAYVGAAALNKATLASCYMVLATPTANSVPSFSAVHNLLGQGVQLNDMVVDADTAGNGVLVTVVY